MSAERGEMTITGLLVAMILFLAVLGATLDLFGAFERTSRETRLRVDAQDHVHRAEEALARDLRNLAGPTASQPDAIDRAGTRDLVFKVADAGEPNAGANASNVKRVRYCLDGAGRLWKMQQRWTTATAPPVPGGATGFVDDPACSPAGWDSSEVVAEKVVNYAGGRSRALFAYNSSTDIAAITSIGVSAFVDDDIATRPAETQLSSGVFLRNQNRKPTAAFTAKGSVMGLMLNGSASLDPEGDILTYCWYANYLAAPQVTQAEMTERKLPCNPGPLVGTGVTYLHTKPLPPGTTIWLEVRDPGGLPGVAPQQTPPT